MLKQRRTMCTPWCSEAWCICCQGARCSVLPEGVSLSNTSHPKCAQGSTREKCRTAIIYMQIFSFQQEGAVFSPSSQMAANRDFIQRCIETSTVHKHAPGSPNCMVFLVKSFTWIKGFSCVTVEVMECQGFFLLQGLLCRCKPTLGGFLFQASGQRGH